MGKTRDTGFLTDCVFTDSSNNVGIGAAASGSYKLQVTGTTNVTGVLTLGSTISNGTNTYTLPSATGTLALTSNLSAYVPYTGATSNLDLGNNHYYGGSILLKQSVGSVSATGYFSLSGSTGTGVGSLILGLGSGTTSSMNFPTSSNYSYVFPATSGTLALTSDLGAYLPLTGGTLTGPLSGTSATFSSTITSLAASGTATIIAEGSATSGEGLVSVRGKNSSGTSRRADFKYDNADVIRIATASPINMQFETNDVTRLTLNGSTGAATFSSSVTINSKTILGSDGTIKWGNSSGDAGDLTWDNDRAIIVARSGKLLALGANGSQNMYISTSGNVGIGKNPSYKLDVDGTGNFSTARATYFDMPNGTGYNFFQLGVDSSAGGCYIYDGTNSSYRMVVKNNGNVLIGTTSDDGLSLHKLQVNGYSRAVQWRSYENGQDVAYGGGFYQQSTSGTTYAVATLMGSAGQMRFWTYNPSDSFQNRMTLTNSGNLLIGTTSDNGSKLQISGSTSITGNLTIGSPSSALAQFHIYNASAAASMLVQTNSAADYSEIAARNYNQTSTCYYRQYSSSAGGTDFGASRSNLAALFSNYASNLAIGTQNGGNLIFGTGNTERMRISTTGAVSIVGSLSKGSGSFRIDHPLESMTETHQLVHSFVEAPQADLYYRGKLTLVNGKAQANIDEVATMTEGTFEVLCREVQCFTTNETGWDLVKGKVIGNIIYIESQNPNSTDEISWLVIGERKDKHMMDTEWTDDNGRVIVEPLKEKLK